MCIKEDIIVNSFVEEYGNMFKRTFLNLMSLILQRSEGKREKDADVIRNAYKFTDHTDHKFILRSHTKLLFHLIHNKKGGSNS